MMSSASRLLRRRFLEIAAAAVMVPDPAIAQPFTWRGRALGADVSLTLNGIDQRHGVRILRRVRQVLDGIERQLSLYRPSDLTRLNATGILANPGRDMLALCRLGDRVHETTGGAFDPSVQPLWRALAKGGDMARARAHCGWRRVRHGKDGIRLSPGMALTFNGVAQGWAADRIVALLRREGLTDVLIDMGEIAALGRADAGRPWQAGIAAPDGRLLHRMPLRDRALATSSPMGTRVGPTGGAHILHPAGFEPVWHTVAVSAQTAAVADALSTAFCLMPRAAIDTTLAAFPDARVEYSG